MRLWQQIALAAALAAAAPLSSAAAEQWQERVPQLLHGLSLQEPAPPLSANGAWWKWSERRIDNLVALGELERAAEWSSRIAGRAPFADRMKGLLRSAGLWLHVDSGKRSLEELRPLFHDGQPVAGTVEGLVGGQREQAINIALEAYLRADALDLAEALVRGPYPAWNFHPRLRIELALRRGQSAVAVDLASKSKDDSPAAWLALALARSNAVDWEQAVTAVKRSEHSQDGNQNMEASAYWFVAAQVAETPERKTWALLQSMRARDFSAAENPLFELSQQQLWRALADYGADFKASTVNQPGLPVRDARWLVQLAHYIKRIEDGDSRSHARILQLTRKRWMTPWLGHIYLPHYRSQKTVFAVPPLEEFAARLGEHFLQEGDFREAAELMAILPIPAVDAFDWRVRRLSILLRGGKVDEVEKELLRMVRDHPQEVTAGINRLLFVLNEMSRGNLHERSLPFYDIFAKLDLPVERLREVERWRGDALVASGRPLEGVRAYLRSAYEGGAASDNWGLAARMQAADVLASEGLLEDARNLYSDLLRQASQERDKNSIRARLGRLRLMAAASPGGGQHLQALFP